MDYKYIPSYSRAWAVEKVLYGFGNITLPRPASMASLGYWFLGLFISLRFLGRIPFLREQGVLIYGAFPVCFAWLMKKAKIHSKSPIRFLSDCVLYVIQPKTLSRFHRISEKKTEAIYFTDVKFKKPHVSV